MMLNSNIPNGPSIGLSGSIKSAQIKYPEGPEKYNNVEVKYGAFFYGCHMTLDTCCEV
jgi:hypothetical protein